MNPTWAIAYWTTGPDIVTDRDIKPDNAATGGFYLVFAGKPASLLALVVEALRGAPCP